MENLVGKVTIVTNIYWRWRRVLPSTASSHNPRIDNVYCGKYSLKLSRFVVSLQLINYFQNPKSTNYTAKTIDWQTWRIICCKIVWVLTTVSFCNILQDVVLTIGLLSLPERIKFKSANGTLEYLLNEIYFILSLQLFSFIILTICLIRIPSMIVDILYKEISLAKTASITEVVELVAKWKENRLVICDLVADVNDFIGWPLFLFIIYGFFISVSFTFTILFRLLATDHHSFSFNCILMYLIFKFFAWFCLLALEAEKLPTKVIYQIIFGS